MRPHPALALATPAAMAQGTPGTHFIENGDLDADGDGLATRAEFTAGGEGWSEMMDQNSDGVITNDDFGCRKN